MSRYIDADAIEKEGWHMQRRKQEDYHTMVLETKKPSEFPTADVVEVVRCKDCFYRRIANDGMTHYYWCDTIQNSVNDDDYCSYGERKSE